MSWPVFISPSWMVKSPGKRDSQAAFAAGTNWRALASIPAFFGTRAAMPAEWISDAPGQVRSCTQTNIPYFCAAAASRTACVCPLHAFNATPV